MKAYGHTQKGDASKLVELEAATPTIGPSDLLVKVKGVPMHPVDYITRSVSGSILWKAHLIVSWDWMLLALLKRSDPT